MTLPPKLRRAIRGQDTATLREVKEIIDEQLASAPEDGAGEHKPPPKKEPKHYFVEKRVYCGAKKCRGCPHGPYRYECWREGKKVITKYIGKVPASSHIH